MNVQDEVNRTIKAGDQHHGLQRPPRLHCAEQTKFSQESTPAVKSHTALHIRARPNTLQITSQTRTSLSRMSWQSSPLKPLAQSHRPCTRSQLPWFEHSAYTAQ
jgi:hypothetical protein